MPFLLALLALFRLLERGGEGGGGGGLNNQPGLLHACGTLHGPLLQCETNFCQLLFKHLSFCHWWHFLCECYRPPSCAFRMLEGGTKTRYILLTACTKTNIKSRVKSESWHLQMLNTTRVHPSNTIKCVESFSWPVLIFVFNLPVDPLGHLHPSLSKHTHPFIRLRQLRMLYTVTWPMLHALEALVRVLCHQSLDLNSISLTAGARIVDVELVLGDGT